jgi:hypothetical protein
MTHATHSAKSTAQPAQPAAQPAQPAAQPAQPAAQPAQPAAQPAQPEAQPAQPEVQPGPPEGRPAAPPRPLSRTFGGEIRRAVAYERGLALKALLCLAVVALIITAKVLWP